ncbi:hypothetical protein [Beijerinckia indica]|uniref:Uncharacterized protein n=1 Tax=Beijerinckia indica subsp. indica (strain ATCC 9039 / DSM 1715 / NCIMB 8712) TaxID=395963 RepID=B2IG17_BEII9|nr:hypothetical protein [Beijerinckia indica]ACB95754.1 hypothetical protein Bind_2134 [Beijerinckia indica subsp. indica ATCC 9039]
MLWVRRKSFDESNLQKFPILAPNSRDFPIGPNESTAVVPHGKLVIRELMPEQHLDSG